MPFPRLNTHGRFVESVLASRLMPDEIAELVQELPNLRKLELNCFELSGAVLDWMLDAIQSPLMHLRLLPFQSSVFKPDGPRYPDPLLLSVVKLQNLQSLEMNALGMTIHVDDVLHVLKMCPHLRSLNLVFLNIVYQANSGGQGDARSDDDPGREFDPPGPARFPIDDSNPECLYVGRRLRTLKIHYCRILDRALLRLLGIDVTPPPTGPDTHGDHCLVHFDVAINASSRLSDKSVTRILHECSRLQFLDLDHSKTATLALFREVRPWACAATLRELSLNLKAFQVSRRLEYSGPMSAANGIAVFSAQEEQEVYDQLSNLRQLQKLRLNAIVSFEMIAVQDMSFAKYLQVAKIDLMFQTLNKPGFEDREMMTQKYIKNDTHKRETFLGALRPEIRTTDC
ncbi:hypothetical protein CPB97_008542 [Podila verticillata]|nr:hypothetical protein CPB97_008542 [Podila verticillata]